MTTKQDTKQKALEILQALGPKANAEHDLAEGAAA